jgi:hypothetical protein
MDGGSTSSKAVLIDYDTAEILTKEYQLSKGNPIQDTKEILARIRQYVKDQGATLEVKGFGATGYAADVLQEAVKSDCNIVETVAHMMSPYTSSGMSMSSATSVDRTSRFCSWKTATSRTSVCPTSARRATACCCRRWPISSAVPITQYAEVAFQAELAPKFSYGCAVFLDSDRVNFQKEGYAKESCWPDWRRCCRRMCGSTWCRFRAWRASGKRFVLQGGTQHNLAASRRRSTTSKIAFPAPRSTFTRTPEKPAQSAQRWRLCASSSGGARAAFIGLDAAIKLTYTSTTDETTRCHFCPNLCQRTFIDTKTPDGDTSRYIAGFSCEKGTVESEEAMLAITKERKRLMKEFPNLVDFEAKKLFSHFYERGADAERTTRPSMTWK